ncbi:peroxiredoxin [Maribacter antarcticus]|uniref:peroxiredoxin n=1 Tax=Maribacter antarcticus TaxID=505250 RepID=UPI00047B4425|nr:peroxiredoxin [Maribacter antarcticus]
MGLKVGDKIPFFTLPDSEGRPFSVKDIIGKQAFVVYFYPKNNTPGCTKEACDFRDSYEDFKKLGAEVIGISADSVKSHSRFGKKHDLPFILLSDSNNVVRKQFKIKNSLLLLPGRETYVVDEKGTILMVYNSINASEHMKRALKASFVSKE